MKPTAWQRGFAVGQREKNGVEDCGESNPYSFGTEECADWDDGWDEGFGPPPSSLTGVCDLE